MNSDPEQKADERLLNAVLQDETWQATEQDLRISAVGAFRRHQRRRRQLRWATGALALVAVITLVLRGSRQPTSVNPSPTEAQISGPSNPGGVHYLGDEELLTLFPPGSCLLVEVDDQKQLIFLDRDVERTMVAPLAARN